MKKFLNLLLFVICGLIYTGCHEDDPSNEIIIPEVDIADDIVGEWVYDNPEEGSWQSMKFVAEGAYFCYSDNKNDWTQKLKDINKGIYGVKGMDISANNGSTYLDMTVSKINGYQFTGRLHETTLDITYHKVVMRTHMNYGESVLPPFEDLVDAKILNYRSHDDKIATIDKNTGEITAVCNNGRTYVDIETAEGTAVLKVMIGRVDDGDENEISPIVKKEITPSKPILNLAKAIIGKWVWDISYWEEMNFLENGKVYYSNSDASRNIQNDNASGNYTIDSETNRLTLKVTPTGSTQMTVIMEMKEISKYSFTAKFFLTNGESTGTFTYAKQIGSMELKIGETILPEYEPFVENATVVKEYRSHNSSIIDVNSTSGEITAKKGGRTYIDVVTEDGTAVIEVTVKSFLAYNYENYLGASKTKVTNTFGKIYTVDGCDLIYDYRTGSEAEEKGAIKDANWDQILFRFDSNKKYVEAISLVAKSSVWFSSEEMTYYLSQVFFPYEKGSTENFKAFMNAETLDGSSVGITWDTTNGILTYVTISK